ncbi:MAG TPA: DUF2247 family protein [Flavipsychrobacter sp.]|nr:DUF2247 family protein [Flavipsychrobacter sp.]
MVKIRYDLEKMLFLLQKNALTTTEVAEKIFSEKYDCIFPELNIIYGLLDSKDEFIEEIKNVCSKISINEEKLGKVLVIIDKEWWIESLGNIINNENLNYQNKIEKIALLWEDVSYPKEWEHFIYYMPTSEKEAVLKDLVVEAQKYIASQKEDIERIKTILWNKNNDVDL